MNATIILASVFIIFIPALMLPGPDFIAVVRSAMTRGTKAGLWTTLGVSLGLGFYATISLVGLSAILVEYQWLAWLVRVLGGCYLIYPGVKLMMAKPTQFQITGGTMKGGNPLLFGFLVTLTNPKAVVLFTSVFATAVTGATLFWLLALMIGLVMLSSLFWYAIVSAFMSSPPILTRFRKALHWVERAAGICFVAIGGRILADARNPVTP